jgi:hypothetical protein
MTLLVLPPGGPLHARQEIEGDLQTAGKCILLLKLAVRIEGRRTNGFQDKGTSLADDAWGMLLLVDTHKRETRAQCPTQARSLYLHKESNALAEYKLNFYIHGRSRLLVQKLSKGRAAEVRKQRRSAHLIKLPLDRPSSYSNCIRIVCLESHSMPGSGQVRSYLSLAYYLPASQLTSLHG